MTFIKKHLEEITQYYFPITFINLTLTLFLSLE